MDLYRTLRVSLYLLAGTGALAISMAEASAFHVALIAVLGVAAYFLIDRGRIKPLTVEMTSALTLVLLLVTMRPLRNDDNWQALFPGAVAHFLCAWQGLLFFSVYTGPVLFTFCGTSLAVVVVSGLVDSGPSLIGRVVIFILVSVWTLYIHALWRARQEFSGRVSMLLTGPERTRRDDAKDDARQLPRRAFWGTVRLVAGLSAACMALGTFIFFSTPRIDGLMAVFEKRGGGESAGHGPLRVGHDTSTDAISGVGSSVRVAQFGRIGDDPRVALTATFSKPVQEIAGPGKALLLKSGSFSEYAAGEWIPDNDWQSIEGKAGESVVILPRDPSLDGPIFSGEEIRMSIDTGVIQSKTLFTCGPVLHVGVKKLEVGREGALRAVTDRAYLDKYTLRFSAPLAAERVPPRARAEHRELRRYVLRRDITNPSEREAMQNLARQITSSAAGDLAKAQAIMSWLRRNCSYTRDFETIHVNGDPIAHFLLARDEQQRRGHCALFASAFVILGRMNNLPARLCTGFAVRVDSAEPGALSAVARNSDAHAWAEIYFRNLGWVAFDPTPPITEAERNRAASVAHKIPDANSADNAQPASANNDSGAPGGIVENYWKTVMDYNWREQRKLYQRLSGSSAGSGAAGLLTGQGWGGFFGAALIWSGVGVAIYFMIQLFTRRGRRRKFAMAGAAGRGRAAVGFYNDLLHALSRRGYTRKPGQTPREFANFVIGRGGEAFKPARDITEIFEAVRYGRSELAQDEFNRLQEALDKIRDMTF